MKIFFALFLFLAAFGAQANDTLTRAQVYNFNVGDTFDYKYEDNLSQVSPLEGYDHISYSRIIVTEVTYSAIRDSLFITEKEYSVLPYGIIVFSQYDTLSVDSSSHYVAFDIPNSFAWHLCGLTFDTGYNARPTNTASWSCGNLGVWEDDVTYAAGIGNTLTKVFLSDGESDNEAITTSLIYYSKSGETWGTPATIAVGIANVTAQQPAVSLIPTINNGRFKIKITNAISADYQLAVYDLTGREIKRAALNNSITNIEITNASSGMYVWKVTMQGAVVQSGKMVVN
jgi:hypothetical protein